MSSDIITSLSYNTPLNSGNSYTTEKTIAGQYTSLSISFYSDQDTTITVQFSPDGTNWDISINQHFTGGVKAYENLVILSKWIRYIIQNTSASNQTSLRVYTYGATQNTSLNALIQKIGGKSPEVSIDNAPRSSFGTPLTTTLKPFPGMAFCFSYLGKINSPVNFNQTQLGWTPYAYTFASTSNGSSSYSSQDNLFSLCGMDGATGDFESMITDNVIPYRAGQTLIARFTAIFSLATLTGQYDMKIGLGVKADKTALPILSGVFVGWDETDQLYLSYINETVETKVLQENFNFDKVDGTGNSGFVYDHSKLNIFQIKYAYLGIANIQFQVMNPADSSFVTMHTFKTAGRLETTHVSHPGGSLLMQVEKKTNASHYALYTWKVGCGSFTAFLTDDLSFSAGYSRSNTTSLTTTNETRVILVRNRIDWVTLRTRPVPILVRDVHTTSYQTSGGGGSGTGIITYRFYRKPTYSVNPSVTNVQTHKSPMAYLTGETISSNGLLFDQFTVLVGTSQVQDYGERFIIPPGEDILITAQTSVINYTCVISLDWIEFT